MTTVTGRQPEIRERRSCFLHHFNPGRGETWCPGFPVIAWGHGCTFDPACDYCYLQLTFRMDPGPVVYSNRDKMFRDIERDWARREVPTLYNAGELADSLMDRDTAVELVKLFAGQKKHNLLLLTKSAEIEPLRNLKHKGRTVVSFSLNAPAACDRFERGAPEPSRRITAAAELTKAGYPIRLRIDPIIPLPDAIESYRMLAAAVCEAIDPAPEVVTLGSLRFDYGLLTCSSPERVKQDASVLDYASERVGERRHRVPFARRVDIYRALIEDLRQSAASIPVGLCKESLEIFQWLGLDWRKQKCNCML